jgi:phage-related protein
MKVATTEIKDFGGGKQMTPAESLQMFMAVILETVIKNGKGILSSETLASLEGSMKGLPGGVAGRAGDAADTVGGVVTTVSDELQKALGGASEAAGSATEAVGGAVEGARRGIGRLIPGGQSDENKE